MLRLHEIKASELTTQEKDSILSHAIELHLLGSDEVDDPGFDIVEQSVTKVKHILRIQDNGNFVGVMYIFPVAGAKERLEMTILIHEMFRGKHYTTSAVDEAEKFISSRYPNPTYVCASVREHNPLRQELTEFLMRHGYEYAAKEQLFTKQIR